MIKRIALLVIILVLSLATPVWAAEAGSGIIEGRLVNGTAGGSSVADQTITLKAYLNDTEKSSATTKTDTEGRFTFAGLVTTDTNYSYDVTVTFQEADYTSERLSFKAGELSKSTELIVYDSTTSDQAVKVTAAHTIIYVGQGSLEVIEVFSFSNESDRTYIGSGEITATGKRRTLRLPLAATAKMTELQYGGELMSCCVVPDKESFWDTMPVLPGSKQVVYSYQVSYSGGEYTYSRGAYSPTASYNFLVQGESVAVASDQLVTQGPVELEGSQFQNLSGGGFAPDDVLVAQLSGLPKTSNQSALIIWAALALVVLMGGFGFVYRLKQRQVQPVRQETSARPTKPKLLVELAQLDDSFEAGRISEGAYRKRRAAVKVQMAELMRRSKQKG